MLTISCPECGSREIRSSLSRTIGERISKFFGFFQFRCKDCDARFSGQIWDAWNMFYAKCPRCYRMDLSTWAIDHYRSSTLQLAKLKLGAHPHRCEYCRNNFVGFRPAKYKFTRGRKTPVTPEASS